jgi:CRP/FNR family transcriptional regulator, nitrogen oxide reductase regulator
MTLLGHSLLQFLSEIEPFKALSSHAVKDIVVGSTVESFPKGRIIFQEDDEADSVWLILKGRVQIVKHNASHRPLGVESLLSGELFGVLCRLGGMGRHYPCGAVAAEAVDVLRIPDGVFLRHYADSGGLVRGVCNLCAQRLKDVQTLRCLAHEKIPQRLASILLRLRQVHGDKIPFTKREVSELLGASLENTFRALSGLQKRGLLTSVRGGIHLLQPEKLKSLSI